MKKTPQQSLKEIERELKRIKRRGVMSDTITIPKDTYQEALRLIKATKQILQKAEASTPQLRARLRRLTKAQNENPKAEAGELIELISKEIIKRTEKR